MNLVGQDAAKTFDTFSFFWVSDEAAHIFYNFNIHITEGPWSCGVLQNNTIKRMSSLLSPYKVHIGQHKQMLTKNMQLAVKTCSEGDERRSK